MIWQVKKSLLLMSFNFSTDTYSNIYLNVNILCIEGIGISHNCSFYSDYLDQQDEQKILLTNEDDFSENEDDIELTMMEMIFQFFRDVQYL